MRLDDDQLNINAEVAHASEVRSARLADLATGGTRPRHRLLRHQDNRG